MMAETQKTEYVLQSCQTLADVVATFPQLGERDALCFFNGFRIKRYSYREIFDLSLRCAAYLSSLGVSKGDRILIWSSNRPEWGIVLCACAWSGIVLVPLDARHTGDFVVRVGRETEAKLLIRSQLRRDPGLPIPTVYMESLLDILRIQEMGNLANSIQPGDLFEILYTSGTTGNPKGVMLTHGNIVSNLRDILEIIPVDREYRLLSVLPLSHALEQTAGFWAPMSGGGSVLYLQALKPSALFEAFQRDTITVMILVPRLLALLKQRIENILNEKHLSGYLRLGMAMAPFLSKRLRKLYFYPIHKRFNPQFRLFVSGGSSLPLEVERFWKNLGFELLQGYGLTETSPVLTATRPGFTRIGSVGHPMRNVELRLKEDREIQAKGPNVFQGYYKNPEATEGVFEEGWFKTGDVGMRDRDGFLYIRSRKKDIIVTPDGINVYPEEIEQVLDGHPQVKESCVLGVGQHEEIIHAVLLLKNKNASDPPGILDSIIAQVNIQLPPEQRIETWSLWPNDEFPKTPTLKIKKVEVRQTINQKDLQVPTQPSHQGSILQQILVEMANVPIASLFPEAQLGRDLGMSSIGRVELIARLEEEFRLDIDDDLIMPTTTVKELELLIAQRIPLAQSLPFRRWTLSKPCQAIRWIFDRVIIRPALHRFCEIQCQGLENLDTLSSPLLIVSNHTSHVDTPLIASLLPGKVGRKICPAAWKEYFDREGRPWRIRMGKWLAWQIATILFNIFPFPQNTAFRRSMAYAGELVDRGWSILYYPEGARSRDGSWGEIRAGVGILAQNLNIPILPVVQRGGEKILPSGAAWPKRSPVEIAFGKPFLVEGLSYRHAQERIQEELTVLYERITKNDTDRRIDSVPGDSYSIH